VTVKVVAFIVAAFIGSLNVALTLLLSGTPVAPLIGVFAAIVGVVGEPASIVRSASLGTRPSVEEPASVAASSSPHAPRSVIRRNARPAVVSPDRRGIVMR